MFNLVIIQNDSARAIYAYDGPGAWDNVLAAYHSELAYRGEGRTKTVCTILDANGVEVRNETWEKTTSESV